MEDRTRSSRDFGGRVALVTGGSGGIGSAIVRGLAGAGATVAVGYGRGRDAADRLCADIGASGGRAHPFGADLADPAAPDLLVDAVEAELGPIDILVANAGAAPRGELADVDAAAWDAVLAVNLRAPFLLARRTVPGMQARGWGRVLFTSSVAAFIGGRVGPHYAASKAGLHGLLHFIASRVAADGVTVNALAPALIAETAMLPGDPAELRRLVPAGRLGRPDEVGDQVLAILRNGYVTNQVIGIDGGMYPR